MLEKPSAKSRKIEFIGDSITCGYGDLASLGESFTTAKEDGMQTYAAFAAENLGADFNVFCASGYGVIRDNGGSTTELIPPIYSIANPFVNKTSLWNFNSFVPDVIVINLGTNDYAGGANPTDFIAGVENFTALVRQKNPNAEIVWASGLHLYGYTNYVEQAVNTINLTDPKVQFVEFTVQDGALNGYGGDGHPNVASHKTAGDELTTALKNIMGWQ